MIAIYFAWNFCDHQTLLAWNGLLAGICSFDDGRATFRHSIAIGILWWDFSNACTYLLFLKKHTIVLDEKAGSGDTGQGTTTTCNYVASAVDLQYRKDSEFIDNIMVYDYT